VTPPTPTGSAPAVDRPAGRPSGPAVVVRGLSKRFGPVLALDRLDLEIPAGSVFGLLGPNGAGKTTTIRILAGLARPSAGEAVVLGRPPVDAAKGGGIGYMPQEPRFYGWMRGRELLDLVGRLHGLPDGERRTRVADALERAGIADAADRRIGGYSGGMRQRLGIAQALLHSPELLVLDEPVSSLDPEGRRDVLELVRGLRGRATVLLSTHVLADVERVCDRVAILDRGRLVAESGLEELLAGHTRAAFRVELEPEAVAALPALAERLRSVAHVRSVTPDPAEPVLTIAVDDPDAAGPAVLAAVGAAAVPVASVARVRPTLEDVFIELVGHPTADELDGRGFRRPREAGR